MKELKILCELGKEERRALLIELPKEAFQGLDIAKDGTVNTDAFLTLMLQYYGNEAVEQAEGDQYESLMSTIYDSGIAVEENPLRKRVNKR